MPCQAAADDLNEPRPVYKRFQMPRLSRRFLLLCVYLVSSGLIQALTPENAPVSDDYILRTWEVGDGLPSNRVLDITQTPDGYLWLATPGGLTRFDGVRFTAFPKGTASGLESERVHSVFTDREGTLWVGLARGGVARKIGNRFQVVVPVAPDSAPTEWTTSFAQDASGAVWFGCEAPVKVTRWQDGRLTVYAFADGLMSRGSGTHQTMVRAMADGTIWYANSDGCGPFDGNRFQSIDLAGGSWPRLAPARDGGMWASRGHRLVRYSPDGSAKAVADLSALSVHVMMDDSVGNLWVGTSNAGLLRFRGGKWEKVPIAGGTVASLFEDREGNLWVGTNSGGVNRLHARRFYLRQTKDGLSDNDIYSLCSDDLGTLWLAGHNYMLARSMDAERRTFALLPAWKNFPGGGAIVAVQPDPTGGIWAGASSGLLHVRDEAIRRASPRDHLVALLVDRSRNVWSAAFNGALICHQADRDLRLPEANGLTRVRALGEDAAGGIWAGTQDGLVFRKAGEHFVRIPLPDARSGNSIHFIVPDGPDTVWIGALNGGLYRWRGGRVDRLPSGAGLPADDLRSLLIAKEDFWLGTGRGLLRLARDEIDAVMDGRRSTLPCIAYGRDDGVPSAEFSVGYRGATATTPDGHLWFATALGALEILPAAQPARSLAPLPVLIEEVRVAHAEMSVSQEEGLIVRPRAGPLEIRYTLAELSSPGRLRFRYRLSGLGDQEWVEVGDQRSVTFARLPPGTYRVDIAASESGGQWHPAQAVSLAFVVQAAWWETVPFRVGAAAVFIVVLIWAVRKVVLLRVRARIRKLEQEHLLERERNRIARDIHDQLGASITQMAITGKLLTLDPPETVAAHSREITSLARGMADSLAEIVWAVNPHHDNLQALVEYLSAFAADFLASAKLACEVDVPADLPARPVSSGVRHHLVLIVKEALNNVVKHSGARTVRLTVTFENPVLDVAVSDDGCGFEPESVTAGSNGIRIFGERMKELGGEFRLESVAGKGTRVAFTLPLPEAHP